MNPIQNEKTGIVHIFASNNNTIILLTDSTGAETLARCSGGMVIKTQHKEGSPYAAMKVAEIIAEKARANGIMNVHVRVRAQGGIKPRNPGQGAEAAIRSLTRNGLRIRTIENVTPVPHNGTRKKKKYRSKKK
ncbi:MAG: 30S ribosomal protein S11 [Candidatus Diapherotrites archaeon]|nr:30S ribosomal protein S11 [Candidatus Diapherotrites archaeon]